MMRTEALIVPEKEQEFPFVAHARMEALVDKLKLLNYESEFLSGLKLKPIHKYYFVITKNPGEQFYIFSLLAAWLIRKCGKKFETPQEFDDPNDTISKIMEEAKDNGMNIDFASNKLKQGVGEQVIAVLDFLANVALLKNDIKLKRPIPPEEKEEEAEVLEDESEINLDRVEEEMVAAYSDDSDEENIFRLDDLKPVSRKEILVSELNLNVDEEAWKLEVERVLPQLKITIRNDGRDWRSHLDQMRNLKSTIEDCLTNTKPHLEKLQRETSSVLEKIGNREKYLNRELEDVLEEYRRYKDQLSKLKENYSKISSGVAERNRELNNLTDKLESIKHQMEERGSSMTDGTPLVNIKKTIAKVKGEIVDMDIRIGVLECILLQMKLQEEKRIEDEYGQSISVF